MKSKNLNRVQMFILFGVVYLFVKCGYRPMKQWLIDGSDIRSGRLFARLRF